MSDRVCDWISDVSLVGFRIRVVSEYWNLQFKFKIWNVKFRTRGRMYEFDPDL